VKLKVKHIAFVIIIALLSSHLYGQKVGLVLSGGGARGVAHIGVLKALEENDIPIDYIAGTSMGAIVGGLYACGYTTDEIEQLFVSDKILSWLSGTIETKYQYYYKESEPNASWQIFKMTYDSVLRTRIPSNIITPYKMDFGFMELFYGPSAAAGYDFDSLFIPFRCVASDITDNKTVILKNGQVENAVRASMTFPFYFKPIKIDGKLMFDGGMYNNFPVDILNIEFSPDIIIGCKAASNYGPPKDDDIISQIQSMLMVNTKYAVDSLKGVLIEPLLKKVNIMDFSYTQEFIDSGYTATIEKIPRIKELVKRKETKEQRIESREDFLEKIPPLIIGDIKINGITAAQEAYVNRLLRTKKILSKINTGIISSGNTFRRLKAEYFKLIAEEQAEYVYPELIYNTQFGYYDFCLDIKRENKLVAELGGLVSSKAINEIFFQMQYKLWGKNAFCFTGNTYLGKFFNSGHFRVRMDIPAYIPLFLETSYTMNSWNYFNTSTYFFEDEKPSYLMQNDNYWKFDLGIPITRFGKLVGEFSIGREKDEYYQTNQFSRLDTTDKTYFDFYSAGLIFELNSLNRKQYASKGVLLRLCARYISGLEKNIPGSTSIDTVEASYYHNWVQLRFLYDNYFETFGPLKLGFYAEASISSQPFFNNYTATVLAAPAFEPVSESQTIFLPQFRAFNYAAVGLKFIFRLFKKLDFRAEGYAFLPYNAILKTEDNKPEYGEELSNRYYIASGSLVYHAPFGPVSICLNYYDQADEPFSFNINIGYLIFNKKPFD